MPKSRTRPPKKAAFHYLIEGMEAAPNWGNVLRTAAEQGWLITGPLALRLTEEDKAQAAALLGKSPALKSSPPLDLDQIIPSQVGPRVAGPPEPVAGSTPPRTRLSDRGGRQVVVDEMVFNILRQKFPALDIHLSPPGFPGGDVVMFTGRRTEAVLLPPRVG